MDSEIKMAVTTERQEKIKRERTNELRKIEVFTKDAQEIELDTKLLNKLARKMGRRKSRR